MLVTFAPIAKETTVCPNNASALDSSVPNLTNEVKAATSVTRTSPSDSPCATDGPAVSHLEDGIGASTDKDTTQLTIVDNNTLSAETNLANAEVPTLLSHESTQPNMPVGEEDHTSAPTKLSTHPVPPAIPPYVPRPLAAAHSPVASCCSNASASDTEHEPSETVLASHQLGDANGKSSQL